MALCGGPLVVTWRLRGSGSVSLPRDQSGSHQATFEAVNRVFSGLKPGMTRPITTMGDAQGSDPIGMSKQERLRPRSDAFAGRTRTDARPAPRSTRTGAHTIAQFICTPKACSQCPAICLRSAVIAPRRHASDDANHPGTQYRPRRALPLDRPVQSADRASPAGVSAGRAPFECLLACRQIEHRSFEIIQPHAMTRECGVDLAGPLQSPHCHRPLLTCPGHC
jgi:hypothetical protein